MKKIGAILLALTMLLSISACSQVESLFEQETTQSQEQIYGALASAILSPDHIDLNKWGKEISFTAMLYGDVFEQEFEEEENGVYLYQQAFIAREDESFFVDVTDIKETFESGAIVTLTGKVQGSIYWTEDNAKVEVMDFKATAIKEFPEEERKPETASKMTYTANNGAGDYEFVGAHKATNAQGDVIVVYFNYTNTGAESEAPTTGQFTVYQGDYLLDKSALEPSDVDSSALPSIYVPTETYAGKTGLYYCVFKASKEADAGDTIYFCMYDDDFYLTHDIPVQISNSLEEMK